MGAPGIVTSAIVIVTGALIFWSGHDVNTHSGHGGVLSAAVVGLALFVSGVILLVCSIFVCLRARVTTSMEAPADRATRVDSEVQAMSDATGAVE